MKFSNRLDIRHITVIVIFLLILYWLLMPQEKDVTQTILNSKVVHKDEIPKKNSQELQLKEIARLNTVIDELKLNHQAESLKLKEENKGLKKLNEDSSKEIHRLKQESEKKKSRVQIDSMNQLDQRIREVSVESDKLTKENEELKKQIHEKIEITKKYKSFSGLKLVHLDLKGAPPKIDYLLKFLKLIKRFGGDGILIEYEDMFPWKDGLKVLASQNAYSADDIKSMLDIAKSEELVVIPLIQTFGHLEFVLKHKVFGNLRANKEVTNSISPLNDKSKDLIKKLIDQIVELHPDVERIHLGADEVWNMRTCDGCLKAHMNDSDLFMTHMRPILEYVQSKKTRKGSPMKPIIWDDMLRRWPVEKLQLIKQLVAPMVWGYVPNLDTYHHFPDGMWKRYATVFNELWIASSFKGALKPWSNFVPTQQHIDNHLSWLKIATKLTEHNVTVSGIAMTGWSRFDHYGPLCELLPAAIPSLAICLGVLQNGVYDNELHENVSRNLGFQDTFKIGITSFKNYKPEIGQFHGAKIYSLVGLVEKAVGWKDWSGVREIGWTRPFQVEKSFLSFYALNTTIDGLTKSLELLYKAKAEAPKIMTEVYKNYTVSEWILDKIDYQVAEAKRSIAHVKEVLARLT